MQALTTHFSFSFHVSLVSQLRSLETTELFTLPVDANSGAPYAASFAPVCSNQLGLRPFSDFVSVLLINKLGNDA